jgi:cobalt/nickel transport system ATP-binding protein
MTALLETKNLSYDYPDGTPALRNVSFKVMEGEKTALVGANGSGKSTLLMHLAGCFAPKDGEVLIRGKSAGQSLKALKEAAGLVFQEPDDQLFMPSVLEDVAFGPAARGAAAEEARSRARECLEMLRIQHLADRPPHRLSGGEKRLAALAGILAMNPEVILLDEPTASLDPKARRNLIETLMTLDRTMAIATHDIEMACILCRTAVLLHNGRVTREDDPKDLLKDEKFLAEHGL